MGPFNFDDSESRLKALFRVLVRSNQSNERSSGVSHYLNLGCAMFGMDYGLLLRQLSSQVAEVIAVGDNADSFYVGQHLTIERTFAVGIFEDEEPKISSKSFPTPTSVPVCTYNGHIVNSFVGAPVHTGKGETLAVIFFASSYLTKELQSSDIESLELLAEGVACMNDLHKSQVQRKMTDQAIFALGSVKTLDEYLEQARLPEVYGIPSRVVEVLRRRIGQSALGIGNVAEELNLSKRTLQRRLQQQDISFADLRDQVRFHYAVDYLVKQHMSIDSISVSLDFSDRTSFTNAFKRWTGLSPSTFRKLFRDYV
jgi:AraC-like DNA-binding protein